MRNLKVQAAAMRKLRQSRKKLGLCQCGRRSENGVGKCKKCNRKRRAYYYEREVPKALELRQKA